MRRILMRSLPLAAALLLGPATARAGLIGVCTSGEVILIDETTGATQLLGISFPAPLSSLARIEPWGLVAYTRATGAPPRLMRVDPVLVRSSFLAYPYLNDVRSLAATTQPRLYAIESIGSGAENWLYWLDLTVPPGDSSIKHLVGQMAHNYVQGMTDGPNGLLYAWSGVHGLITIDPLTAATADVNGLPDGNSSIQTLAWSPAGVLYGAGERLFQVDPHTGLTTPVGAQFPFYQVMGMEYWDPAQTTRYCVPKANSISCLTVIDSSGSPSMGGADDFHVLALNVPSHRTGLMLWSLSAQNLPFQFGTLCVGAPIGRTPAQNSGGTAGVFDCSGGYSFHFSSAFAQAHGLGVGTLVHAQYYFRDPGQLDGTAVGLTDALRFTLLP
jgi:hypothetical protein